MKCIPISTLFYLSSGSFAMAETLRGQQPNQQLQVGAFASVDRPPNKDDENKKQRPHKKMNSGAEGKFKKKKKRAKKLQKSETLESPEEGSTATERGDGKSTKSDKETHSPTSLKTVENGGDDGSKNSKNTKAGKTKAGKTKTSKKPKSSKKSKSRIHPLPTISPTDMPNKATIAPTSIPPGAVIYYDSFEIGTFPDDPEWSVDTSRRTNANMKANRSHVTETFRDKTFEEANDSTKNDRGLQSNNRVVSHRHWALTTDEAKSGVNSIKSPNLTSDDAKPRSAYVTLTTDQDWDEGYLTFSSMWDLNYPGSDLLWYVDDEFEGWVPAPSSQSEWEEFQIYLESGQHRVTWEYAYNPNNEVDPPEAGVAYIDDIYYTEDTRLPTYNPTLEPTSDPTPRPSLSPMSPSYSPTSVPPTYFPTYFPTDSPGSSATSSPTTTFTAAPTPPATPEPVTQIPSSDI